MATNLSEGVAKLAKEIAIDQIAQDLDFSEKLGHKADLASPTLTGTPKAPTAVEGTNSTQIATTAFVNSAVSGKSAIADGVYSAFTKFNKTNGVK